MNNTNSYISINRFMCDPAYQKKLIYWFDYFSNEDQQDVEDKGFTKEMFHNISEKADKITKILRVLYVDELKSYKNLFILYYKNKIDQLKKYADDFNQIYEDCENNMKDDKNLIKRDFGGFNDPNDIFEVGNPYALIPEAINSLQSFIKKLEQDIRKINTKNLIFSDNFTILSTINKDIKDKGFKSEEIADLETAFSTLLLKGFALWQVKVKINEKELLLFSNNERHVMNIKEDEINNANVQKYSEKKYLIGYVYDIYESCNEVDFDKLDQIYQNHSGDEAGQILKPLMEVLIPYYKSLITVEGMIKNMYEFSRYYQPFLRPINYGYLIKPLVPDDFIIFPLYLKYLPLRLINAPGEKYNDLFKMNFDRLNKEMFLFSFLFDEKWFPKELEEVENMDTLQQQKYYVLWKLMNYASQVNFCNVDMYDHCLCLSLFDWKIDDDSQDARNYENFIKTIVSNALKNYPYSKKNDEKTKTSFRYFANYIINVVNQAQEPLNQNELKEKLSQLSMDASNKKEIEGPSEGGCCTIQ